MPSIYVKQLESLLANRKQQRGICGDFGSGRGISRAWAFTHRLDLDRARGSDSDPSDFAADASPWPDGGIMFLRDQLACATTLDRIGATSERRAPLRFPKETPRRPFQRRCGFA